MAAAGDWRCERCGVDFDTCPQVPSWSHPIRIQPVGATRPYPQPIRPIDSDSCPCWPGPCDDARPYRRAWGGPGALLTSMCGMFGNAVREEQCDNRIRTTARQNIQRSSTSCESAAESPCPLRVPQSQRRRGQNIEYRRPPALESNWSIRAFHSGPRQRRQQPLRVAVWASGRVWMTASRPQFHLLFPLCAAKRWLHCCRLLIDRRPRCCRNRTHDAKCCSPAGSD